MLTTKMFSSNKVKGRTCTQRAVEYTLGFSTWPRGLRHVKSSSAQTLGSWVHTPLEVRMSAYSVFVSALRRADPLSEESYRLSVRFIVSELSLNGHSQERLIRQRRKRMKEEK
jgi:hypothetical protein